MYNMILMYIDPGTGSMLFAILIGLFGTGMYMVKKMWLDIKSKISGGRASISEESMPYVLFSDSKNYYSTYKPICDEFERRGIDVVYWTAAKDDLLLNIKYNHIKCEFIGEKNKAFAKLNMMHADICLSTTPGLDVYQWKRSRYVRCYVHVMHSAATTLLYRMFGMDYYDSILLTGDFQEKEIRELEMIRKDPPKELRVVGCIYLDELKKKMDSDVSNGDEAREITVLVAPSWGETAMLKKYGNKLIDALIGTGFNVIIRPHPQSMISEKEMIDNLMKRYPESEKIEWNFDTDNYDSLNRADIMITDFSSVMLDFALVFDKPVMYAEYQINKSVYDAAWIDHRLWQEEVFPQIGTALGEEQISDIKSTIEAAMRNTEYAKGREKARKEAWMHIGHSAELTVDYLVQKRESFFNDKQL